MKNIKKIMITVVKENLSPIVDLFIYRFDLRIDFIFLQTIKLEEMEKKAGNAEAQVIFVPSYQQ